MSAAQKLDQFAVKDSAISEQYPFAPKGQRFIAAMLDAFFYSVISAVIQSVILKTAGGGMMTIAAMALIFPVVYFVFPLYASGQTLGKKVMKLQVVGENGDPHLTFWQAMNREMWWKFISGIVLMLGYIRILTHPEGRAWHDSKTGTKVISIRED